MTKHGPENCRRCWWKENWFRVEEVLFALPLMLLYDIFWRENWDEEYRHDDIKGRSDDEAP